MVGILSDQLQNGAIDVYKRQFLHTGTIEVRPRITVIHQNFQVCIPVVTGISVSYTHLDVYKRQV